MPAEPSARLAQCPVLPDCGLGADCGKLVWWLELPQDPRLLPQLRPEVCWLARGGSSAVGKRVYCNSYSLPLNTRENLNLAKSGSSSGQQPVGGGARTEPACLPCVSRMSPVCTQDVCPGLARPLSPLRAEGGS